LHYRLSTQDITDTVHHPVAKPDYPASPVFWAPRHIQASAKHPSLPRFTEHAGINEAPLFSVGLHESHQAFSIELLMLKKTARSGLLLHNRATVSMQMFEQYQFLAPAHLGQLRGANLQTCR
jgi:hypothetical protein